MRLPGSSAIAAAAVPLALAACTSGTPKAAPTPHPAPTLRVVSSVATPGCGDASGAGAQLPAGLTHLSKVRGYPFGVAVTAGARWSFVSLLSNNEIGVFADTGSASPRLVRAPCRPVLVSVDCAPPGAGSLAPCGSRCSGKRCAGSSARPTPSAWPRTSC